MTTELETHDESSSPITQLSRFQSTVGFINNLLMIPMFTVMILEATGGQLRNRLVLFDVLNLWFCGAFLFEWALGFALSKNRLEYIKSVESGLDLISAIPFGYFFQTLRVARLVRILRVVRLILRARRFRGKGAKLLRVIGVVGATVFAGGLGLRIVEPDNVTTLSDALWWSIITVSTVGYGDIAPVTGTGRMVASVLVFVGIGVFGFVAGFMSSLMEDPEEDEILMTVKRLEAKIDKLAS